MRCIIAGLAVLSSSIWAQGQFQSQKAPSQYLAPYVNSPNSVVERMLAVANLKPGETLYDLGSGDGRVVIAAAAKDGVKAVGIELSERLVKSSTEKIKNAGLEEKASVIHANLLDVDISKADVVTIYLLRDSNDLVRPKLESSLKPGARVISHDYEIRGWKPLLVDKPEANHREHVIYVYEMPQKKK